MNARYSTAPRKSDRNWRMKALRLFFLLAVLCVGSRLFTLQVLGAGFYSQLASGQHSFYKELFAERGDILVRDWRDEKEYFAATNQPKAFVYADPRRVEDPQGTALALAHAFGWRVMEEPAVSDSAAGEFDVLGVVDSATSSEPQLPLTDEEQAIARENENYQILLDRLSKTDDPYEPVERNVSEETLSEILALELPGIDYILEKSRSYPEADLGGQVFGFVGNSEEGKRGYYGIEGYFEEFLSGKDGFLDSETDAKGHWIGVGNRVFEAAEDGGDVLLTLDRTIQYVACAELQKGVEATQADGGSVVIIEPSTGRVMGMCSSPDFDPNVYNEVEDIAAYNNRAIANAYEPGSVFKPLIMAAGIDMGVIDPNTIYEDKGEEVIDQFTIRNSDLKAHGWQSMTNVLEKSLNTGMIFVMRRLGFDAMERYVHDFGFGTLTGITLTGEVSGTVSSLQNKHEVYYATASYGQGITVTVLQLAAAYGAIANGGTLMKPYIVEELRAPDGTVEVTKPQVVRQVVSKKTATTVGAMMVSVLENGHGTLAKVPGYYIAGKTGTAQVAKGNGGTGYETDYTKATFVGFGPVDNPAFAMVVMLDHPRTSPWAEGTAVPIWGSIADFLLQYLEVAPKRAVD